MLNMPDTCYDGPAMHIKLLEPHNPKPSKSARNLTTKTRLQAPNSGAPEGTDRREPLLQPETQKRESLRGVLKDPYPLQNPCTEV